MRADVRPLAHLFEASSSDRNLCWFQRSRPDPVPPWSYEGRHVTASSVKILNARKGQAVTAAPELVWRRSGLDGQWAKWHLPRAGAAPTFVFYVLIAALPPCANL